MSNFANIKKRKTNKKIERKESSPHLFLHQSSVTCSWGAFSYRLAIAFNFLSFFTISKLTKKYYKIIWHKTSDEIYIKYTQHRTYIHQMQSQPPPLSSHLDPPFSVRLFLLQMFTFACTMCLCVCGSAKFNLYWAQVILPGAQLNFTVERVKKTHNNNNRAREWKKNG